MFTDDMPELREASIDEHTQILQKVNQPMLSNDKHELSKAQLLLLDKLNL